MGFRQVNEFIGDGNLFVADKAGHEVMKILDFGISNIHGATDLATKTSTMMGTPAYMSPEQARGRASQVDARADQFALGAIVYEMLGGRAAFWAPDCARSRIASSISSRSFWSSDSPCGAEPSAMR